MVIIKTIGIILRNFEENKKYFVGVRKDLFKTLYNYDVNLIGIPIDMNFSKIKNLVLKCDGIILSGGDNYIKNDFLLLDFLYKNNIPTLGICLGMQIMGIFFSDKLEVTIKNHCSDKKYVHYINVIDDSLLKSILGANKILVNSRHKSAISDTRLKIGALSEDGIIEEVEDKTKKFFVGVEWHPESLNDDNSKKIFDYFISVVNKE